MQRLVLALWLVLAPLAALAQGSDLSNPQTDQSQLTRNKGQLPATATNDFASAGNAGELLTSTCPITSATVTVTIASPAVVTYTAHGLLNQRATSSQPDVMDVCPIVFTTTGALPTGITSGTTYWTVPSSYTTNTFQIATSPANAIAGTSVNTSGTQSGTHTGTRSYPLPSLQAKTVTARSLTAGDWDVSCAFKIVANTTTITAIVAELSPTDNSTPATLGNYFEFDATINGGGTAAFSTPVVPLSLAIPTTYFCPALVVYGSNSVAAGAKLVARRKR